MKAFTINLNIEAQEIDINLSVYMGGKYNQYYQVKEGRLQRIDGNEIKLDEPFKVMTKEKSDGEFCSCGWFIAK